MKKIIFTLSVLFALSVGLPVAAQETSETPDAEQAEEEVQLISAPAISDGMETSTEELTQEFGGIVFTSGNAVRLTESTNKDVVLMGSLVTLDAPVQGDVFAAGSDVVISESVAGSVRAAGNSVTIDSEIFGNVLAFGANIRVTENAVIHGYLNAYGASVIVDGVVEQSADLRGADLEVTGMLNSAYMEGETVAFGATSVLNGPVTVKSPVAPKTNGAQGTELITFIQATPQDREEVEDSLTAGDIFMWFVWIIFKYVSFLLLTIVLIAVFPSLVNTVTKSMREQSGRAWGWGALVFILAPSALLVVALTMIGLPLSVLVGTAYLLSLVLGEILTAVLVGRWLLKTTGTVSKGQLIGAAALGLAIGCVVISIPFLGWLVKIAAMMYGLGGILLVVFGSKTGNKTGKSK